MSKGTLLKFFCLYVLKPVMLPCLPTTGKLYHNKPHRRGPWFAYETPAEIARSLQKGCSKKRNRKATVLLSSCRGSSRAPPVGLKGKSWWLRGAGLRGGGGGGGDLCVVPPQTKGPVPRRKVLKCKASSQLLFSLLVAFGSVKLWIPIAWTGHMWISSNPTNPVPKCFFVCGGNTHRSKWKWP